MGGDVEVCKDVLVEVIYATMAEINGWDESDLPAKLITFILWRLAAMRLVDGK